MSQTRKLLLITNSEGRVVAAANHGESSQSGLSLAIRPLPGQRVHEVEVPEPITRLSGRDFSMLMSQARFEVGPARLSFPKIRIERRAKGKGRAKE
jgi:hypothetical protein